MIAKWHAARPGHTLGPLWSWSTRPDLWGPGWRVSIATDIKMLAACGVFEVDYGDLLGRRPTSPVGLVEAALVAGLVTSEHVGSGHTWVEGWP